MPALEMHWGLPPEQWHLNEASVHVWAASLDMPVQRIFALEQTLSSDELDRATRYYFERDRKRFIAGRGTLRAILSSYFKIDPMELRFAYGPRGKPMLTGSSEFCALHFNLAHSDDLALIALTRACPVGIDVECIHSVRDVDNIARRFFPHREAAQLMALPPEQRALSFLNLWTRKEACYKATDSDLSRWLKQIEVSFLPGEPARVLGIAGNPQATACWTLEELSPAYQFKGAVAVAASGLQFHCWRWPFF
jgi:4'-phosphopantetheinyl transferase